MNKLLTMKLLTTNPPQKLLHFNCGWTVASHLIKWQSIYEDGLTVAWKRMLGK